MKAGTATKLYWRYLTLLLESLMFTKWIVLQHENPYLDARMNSCRTLTSQSLDGLVAGASSRPWLRDTLWMYRADRQRWFGYIPKKHQSESKNGVFGCFWAVEGLWMGDLDSFQVPKSECVQARLGQNSASHAWSVWPQIIGEEILPVMHEVFKFCNSPFISLPSADLVFMPGGCKSMVRFWATTWATDP